MLTLGIANASVVIGFDRCSDLWIPLLIDNDENVLHHSADFLGVPQRTAHLVASITILIEEFEVEQMGLTIVEEGDLTAHRRPAMPAGVTFESHLGYFHVAQRIGRQLTRTIGTQRHENPLLGGEVTSECELKFRVKH